MPIMITVPKEEYIIRKQKKSDKVQYQFLLNDLICTAYDDSLDLEYSDPYEYFTRYLSTENMHIDEDKNLVIELAPPYMPIERVIELRF